MLLQARDLSIWRAAASGRALVLDGVSFDVAAGEVVDVGGPSGVGKSTLLLALARLLPGTAGVLRLGDVEASAVDAQQWRRDVLYVPQTPSLRPGTVADALSAPWHLKVRAGEDPPSEASCRAALETVGLPALSSHHETGRLSVGQAARVMLARALLATPKVLLLDEPDANLDDAAARLVHDAVRAFAATGRAVVRVRHRSGVDGSDRRLLLDSGRLSEVSPDGT